MSPQFLSGTLDTAEVLTGIYEPKLVALSYAIAALGAFCALTISKNNLNGTSSVATLRFWHWTGAIAMGTGVWAMHFLGMLAFRLPIPVTYDPLTTALSAFPAILASWVVIKIVTRKFIDAKSLVAGGTLMGLGIGGMHYSGMAGMRLDAMMYYQASTFSVSVAVAVLLSIAALYTTFRLRGLAQSKPLISRIAGASIMGGAVGTMHYTGMAATHYFDACTPDAAQTSEIHYWILGGAIAVTTGLIIGFTTVAGIVDYNFRSAAARALETQEILSRVLENTHQGYIRLDSQATVQELNHSMCSMLGRPKEEILKKPFRTFICSETHTQFPNLFDSMGTGLFEITLLDDRDRPLPCLYHATETLDKQGNKNGIVGLLTDITEIRRREEQSKERAENVASIMDHLTTGVVLIDEDARIQLFNESCEAMFGYSKNEMLLQPIEQLLDAGCKQAFCSYISGLTSQASRIANQEFTALRKDGSSFPIEFGANQIVIDSKIMLAGTFQDISMRKQEQKRREELETELIHSSKLEAVGQLAGGIAHEINTPIQFIGDNLGYLETEFASILPLLEKINNSTDGSESASDTVINRNELLRLLEEIDIEFISTDIPQAISQSIHGIRDVSRIVQSMKEFSHPGSQSAKVFDVKKAIENTVAISKAEWRNVAEVEMDFSEETPQITCIPGAINQVLLNMVVNAAHAIGEAKRPGVGKITLKTQKQEELLLIQISDTGTGIPEEISSKVFDPFFTTKQVGRGTGQGLAISWDIIVKKHGGSIEIDTALGKGTTFSIRLPISPPANSQKQPLS